MFAADLANDGFAILEKFHCGSGRRLRRNLGAAGTLSPK
jgi:hypothetical protein